MKKHDGAIAEETSTKNGGNFQEIVEIFRKGQLGRLFAGATENTLIQFFRYCFVGGAATIVDWGLSSLLFYFAFLLLRGLMR